MSDTAIGAAADELTLVLSDVEDGLVDAFEGTTASVPVTVGTTETTLSFRQLKDDWCLAIVAPDGKTIPLVHASRRLRVASAGVLQALYAALTEASGADINATKAATEKARAFVLELRKDRRA